MIFEIPKTCTRCSKLTKPKNMRVVFWPLGKIINGSGGWLCKSCHGELQLMIGKWMKNK